MGEIGLRVNMEGGRAAGAAEPWLPALVYFGTGRSSIGAIGNETMNDLVFMLADRLGGGPAQFRIDIIGGSSGRWRGTDDSGQANQLNMEPAGQRAKAVEAVLQRMLPNS